VKKLQIGRVLTIEGMMGTAEFLPTVRNGEFIYYVVNANRRINCQITALKSSPCKGVYGNFRIFDAEAELPKSMAELYHLNRHLDNGVIEIGATTKNEPVKLAVNPFFLKVLIAGASGRGKTHMEIVLEEEFVKQNIPTVVIDPHGEFARFCKFSNNAVVIEDTLDFEYLLSMLQKRKTVVYDLQGLKEPEKTERVYETLNRFMETKEKDYKRAAGDGSKLKIPPVLLTCDETEIFAPSKTNVDNPECRQLFIDYAKRGRQYGIGMIVGTQQASRLSLDIRSQCNSAMIFRIVDEGSRAVIRGLPFISRVELTRVRTLELGQCLVTGALVDYPLVVNVRDIVTPRAKESNFEKLLGVYIPPVPIDEIPKPLEETPSGLNVFSTPGKPNIQAVTSGASVNVLVKCPDCGKPMIPKKGRYYCQTNNCNVIMATQDGHITRAAAPAISRPRPPS
jgi:DNA helicase HerA-like ATPase